jgi:hypothetical protein
MANAELLRRTLEHIKENPTEWDQRGWFTCFAGITVKLNGDDLEMIGRHPIGERAAELLGLEITSERCCEICGDVPVMPSLFSSDNTLADLERIVGELTAA